MALPLSSGLVPTEVAFLCEMEMITIVPRQRLESIPMLSGKTPALRPPRRADLPLWLALLLKKQRRANIVPPPWLLSASLQELVNLETNVNPEGFSEPPPPPMRSDGRGVARPYATMTSRTGDEDGDTKELVLSSPFLPSCTQDAPSGYLPFHWLEIAETLLAHAADDIPNAPDVRALLRDLQEVRAAKLRASTRHLEGGGGVLKLRGVGAMELAESRGFVLSVVDGVRKLGASIEAGRREEELERREGGGGDESDDDMEL
ncbi:GINS complex, PSF2 component [Xylaria bambusicola]|uniref:GINS complex, PSF2 component n=1 Tax=Xylaria bambusicola TaxID=326684 RepID=UPI002007A23C|nr:GINS complex, PSF2 component [Xylaria bambusicola]KAI0520809.1 GINS complex, PSF2 component [Xylaria bambusicola]